MTQFMYLRSKGTKKNPGRHPIGIVGVQKFEDCVQVAISTIHSEDRFVKTAGKEVVRAKLVAGNVVMIASNSPVNLHAIIPKGMSKRLDNYVRHQEIFELLVADEMAQGTWAKQNSDLLRGIDREFQPNSGPAWPTIPAAIQHSAR